MLHFQYEDNFLIETMVDYLLVNQVYFKLLFLSMNYKFYLVKQLMLKSAGMDTSSLPGAEVALADKTEDYPESYGRASYRTSDAFPRTLGWLNLDVPDFEESSRTNSEI